MFTRRVSKGEPRYSTRTPTSPQVARRSPRGYALLAFRRFPEFLCNKLRRFRSSLAGISAPSGKTADLVETVQGLERSARNLGFELSHSLPIAVQLTNTRLQASRPASTPVTDVLNEAEAAGWRATGNWLWGFQAIPRCWRSVRSATGRALGPCRSRLVKTADQVSRTILPAAACPLQAVAHSGRGQRRSVAQAKVFRKPAL